MKISVTILTRNSEAKLGKTLESVRSFDEIIVLDSLSTDKTEEIARSFPNVKFFAGAFLGFGPMKKKAASLAKNDWILNLDSDERLNNELIEDLSTKDLNPKRVYEVSRRNHYRGKWIKGCDWYPDSVIRLYDRTQTNYNDSKIHEKVELKEGIRVESLQGAILHYPYENISELIQKLDHYSTLYASEKRGKNISLFSLSMRAAYSFFRNYILKRGILLGREGLLISFCSAAGVFYKNMKLLEANDSLKS
ncbi:MAG: glycosyltransferase family 2 protein [Bdellovibrionota bacterium]